MTKTYYLTPDILAGCVTNCESWYLPNRAVPEFALFLRQHLAESSNDATKLSTDKAAASINDWENKITNAKKDKALDPYELKFVFYGLLNDYREKKAQLLQSGDNQLQSELDRRIAACKKFAEEAEKEDV